VLQKVEQKASSCGSRPGAIGLADTMGWASPLQIKRLVDAARDRWPSTPITLHLHDTRALAIANVVAALEMGIDCYDSAVAGMGGCPFAAHKGAALAERVVGHPLPGKLKSGGNLETYRARAAAGRGAQS